MSESERPLFRSFPMPSRDAWPGLKERAARHWPAGLSFKVLYTEADAVPPAPPPGTGDYARGVRSGGGVHTTRVGCQVALVEAEATATAVEREVVGGVDLIWLQGMLADATSEPKFDSNLVTALAKVDLRDRSLVLDLGPATARIGRQLLSCWHRGADGHSPGEVSLAIDPFAWVATGLAGDETLEAAMAGMLATARWSSESAPGWRSVMVSTVPHRAAGATIAEEIAAAIATGLRYLRAMVAAGMAADAAAREVRFTLTVGRDVFAEIAKLRALRRLWSRVVRSLGGGTAAQAAAVYVRTAETERTGYGRWINQLRATVEGFAAWVAGADGLVLVPFDSRPSDGGPAGTELGRRLVRTTQHILAEEAHLGRVADPAGGSWFLEAITDRLARAAWDSVRKLEARGGIGDALRDGFLDQIYAEHAAKHAHDVATRRDRWVGVTAFPDREETWDEIAGEVSSSEGQPGGCLPVRRPTAAFEALRAASDRIAAIESRPTVLLVTVGCQADFQGPVSGASRALAVAGIATEEHHEADAEEAFARLGSTTAVICGADAALRDKGPARIIRLRAAGASLLLVTAPQSTEAFWHQAGADLLLDDQSDLYAILCRVHAELGVRGGAPRKVETGR